MSTIDPLQLSSPSYVEWKKRWDPKIVSNFTPLDFETTLFKQIDFMCKANCSVWNINFFNNLGGYVKQYAQYLQIGSKLLTEKNNDFEFDALSPTYNIDLIWHTHMMYPQLYRQDCSNITNGMILDHDDTSVGDEIQDKVQRNELNSSENENEQININFLGFTGNVSAVMPVEKSNYWTYGRLGQFKTEHFISVVLKTKYKLIVVGYIRKNAQQILIPREVVEIIADTFFNDASILEDI
eukprot:356267_1